MRLEKWFITTLDDSQKKVIEQDVNQRLIVQGVAGSGKTNLAIHKALQASTRGSYAIVIFFVALKRMVAYGMQALGLDRERIAYEWAWLNRGFDMVGDLYVESTKQDNIRLVNNQILYLVNDIQIRQFVRAERTSTTYGIDFETWVPDRFYRAFGRRVSWFTEVKYDGGLDITKEECFEMIPGGILYKQCETNLDYLVVDEGQDFSVQEYKVAICPRAKQSLCIFGDSAQQIRGENRGSSMAELAQALGESYKCMSLENNYRVPLNIARFAQHITGGMVDLVSNNRRGDNGPRPVVVQCQNREAELDAIMQRIKAEDLDDVAILVESNEQAIFVNKYLNGKGMKTQTFFRTGNEVPFDTINTLDFSNGDIPCVLTYSSAKGAEFDNVFIPFANSANDCGQKDFYVACTRSSRNLVISYSGAKIKYLECVDSRLVDEYRI